MKQRSHDVQQQSWGLALLFFCLLFCMAGYCVAESNTQDTPRKLIAVIPADLPPTYFVDKSSNPAGFAIDITNELARRAGLTVEYVNTGGWDNAIQMVLDGKADLIPSLTINEQRMELLTFTQTVDFLLINLVVASGNKTIQEIAPGLTIGVLKGSAPHNFLEKNQTIQLATFNDLHTMLFALLAGHVDGIVSLTSNIMKLAADAGVDDRVKVVGTPIIEAKRAIALRKEDTALVTLFNQAIAEFVDSPEYRKLYVKWYGKPKSYWTASRVGLSMAALMLLLIAFFTIWRFREKNLETRRLEQVNYLLLKSEEKHRLLFENAGDAIFIHNDKGTILASNTTACKRLGYSHAELMSLSVGAVDTPEQSQYAPERIARLLEQERIEFETVHQRKDGSPVPIEVNARLITWDGEPAIMSICRDITERKQAEEEKKLLQQQLLQAQKMEAIGTLAGGIAHDFNNILGAILGYTEIARDTIPPESFAAKSLDKVLEASHRASTLVKQILAFSRQEKIERHSLEPAHFVKEALKLLRPSLPSTIEIRQQIDSTSKPILADPTQVHQILINLCTNAFHAMEMTGGILEITLKDCELSQHDLQEHPEVQPGSFAVLSISDTGSGIDPDVWGRIFDPYFTTKAVGKGTGMGLSIVHGIVTSYGGFITSEKNLGGGTVFRVFFPAIEQEVVAEVEPVEVVPLGTERILLVDDEEMLAELGKTILEGLGYEVTALTSSLDALALFQNHPDRFDAVITDQTMPGMIGKDLAGRILQIRPDLPIILCTGHSSLFSEGKVRSWGIKGFAMKPLSKKVIATLVRKVLDESRMVR